MSATARRTGGDSGASELVIVAAMAARDTTPGTWVGGEMTIGPVARHRLVETMPEEVEMVSPPEIAILAATSAADRGRPLGLVEMVQSHTEQEAAARTVVLHLMVVWIFPADMGLTSQMSNYSRSVSFPRTFSTGFRELSMRED